MKRALVGILDTRLSGFLSWVIQSRQLLGTYDIHGIVGRLAQTRRVGTRHNRTRNKLQVTRGSMNGRGYFHGTCTVSMMSKFNQQCRWHILTRDYVRKGAGVTCCHGSPYFFIRTTRQEENSGLFLFYSVDTEYSSGGFMSGSRPISDVLLFIGRSHDVQPSAASRRLAPTPLSRWVNVQNAQLGCYSGLHIPIHPTPSVFHLPQTKTTRVGDRSS